MHSENCVVCGRQLGLTWAVDHFDEPLCHTCVGRQRCWSCDAATGGTGIRSTTILDDGRIRCGRCSKGAVDTQSDVGSVVRLVRPLLHSYGIRLPNRVRVLLTTLTELEKRAGRPLHGLTVTEYYDGGGPGRVLELRVADGLPATQFGQVLAHEMGHAWLAGYTGTGRTQDEEEGICELLGSWWLLARGGRLSKHLLDGMSTNPDPVYGEGFRRARDRTRGLTPGEVVTRVQRTGRLPS